MVEVVYVSLMIMMQWDQLDYRDYGHHEIGKALFFLDIVGKITWKIVGLYTETKVDKVVYKHEQIGIERQDIAKGP